MSPLRLSLSLEVIVISNNIIIIITTSPLVPSAPGELAGEISNDTSVYLSWTFPEEPNGVLSSFHLFYGKTESTTTEMVINNMNEYCFTLLILLIGCDCTCDWK